MGKEYHKKLLDIFNKLEEKASKNGEKTNFVPREPFLIDILEDPWFELRLDEVVRVSVDGEEETLDQILERINTTHKTESTEDKDLISFD